VRGSSNEMAAVLDDVARAVTSDRNILLLGENGTGKEVMARLIHASDPTRAGAFVAVNSSAIPAELLEAELFGVEGRAATGIDARPGAFRAADRGTLLLDEIGDMPPALQAKLLRAVEERAVTPLGTSKPQAIDVRIIAATNHDLHRLVESETFRRDLYYRLSAITITIPPLRQRRDDIPQLAAFFAQRASRRLRKSIRGISAGAMERLVAYDWPGNVRELDAVIERAVLSCSGSAIESQHIDVVSPKRVARSGVLDESLAAAERTAITDTLRAAGGNRSEAARRLGISRMALYNKMKRLGIV
jgi:two-component system response regulator HydG